MAARAAFRERVPSGVIDDRRGACAFFAGGDDEGRPVIHWQDEQRGDAIVGLPAGRVDEATVQDFSAGVDRGVDRAAALSAKALVVDLSGIAYMSSRGLRALTLAKRRADGLGVAIALAAPNDVMREILAISRYDKIFAVRP